MPVHDKSNKTASAQAMLGDFAVSVTDTAGTVRESSFCRPRKRVCVSHVFRAGSREDADRDTVARDKKKSSPYATACEQYEKKD